MSEWRAPVAGGEVVGTATGEGPALLVLHGGPGLSDYMASAAEELVGWHAISYTQRGPAPSTAAGPFTVDQHVADAVAVLDRHGLDRAVVLGHSWGGLLAVALAAAVPERVRGLVLVDPLGITGDGGFAAFGEEMLGRTSAEDRASAEELDRIAMAGEGTGEEGMESLRLLWPAYFADPSAAPPMPPDLALSDECYGATLATVVPLLESGALEAAAGRYPGPVEVVHGAASPMPASSATAAAAAFPAGSATAVPGGGHFLWLEQPGHVRAALTRLAGRLT